MKLKQMIEFSNYMHIFITYLVLFQVCFVQLNEKLLVNWRKWNLSTLCKRAHEYELLFDLLNDMAVISLAYNCCYKTSFGFHSMYEMGNLFSKELEAKSNIICKLPTTGHLKVKQQHIFEINRGWSMRITSEKLGR